MRSGRRTTCQRMKPLPSSSSSSFPPSSFLQQTAGVQHSTTRGVGEAAGAGPSLPSLAAAELSRCRGPGEAAVLLAPPFSRPLPEGLRLLLRDRFRDRPRAMVRRGLRREVSATPRSGMPKASKRCAASLRGARAP